MLRWGSVLTVLCALSLTGLARAGVIPFINDYEGFLEAAGDVQVIDFETLPDGSASYHRAPITPEFSYTEEGVTFSSPFPELLILDIGDFGLAAANPQTSERNWIIAEFLTPATALGIFFPGGTTLSVFDAEESLLGSATFGGSGSGFFIGVISDVPIASAIGDRGSDADVWHSVHFTPVPEPVTLALLSVGGVTLLRRRH